MKGKLRFPKFKGSCWLFPHLFRFSEIRFWLKHFQYFEAIFRYCTYYLLFIVKIYFIYYMYIIFIIYNLSYFIIFIINPNVFIKKHE